MTSRSRPFRSDELGHAKPAGSVSSFLRGTELANGQEREDLSEKLNQLGLWEKQEDSPFLLSQGQQRRLAVACLIDREDPDFAC